MGLVEIKIKVTTVFRNVEKRIKFALKQKSSQTLRKLTQLFRIQCHRQRYKGVPKVTQRQNLKMLFSSSTLPYNTFKKKQKNLGNNIAYLRNLRSYWRLKKAVFFAIFYNFSKQGTVKII